MPRPVARAASKAVGRMIDEEQIGVDAREQALPSSRSPDQRLLVQEAVSEEELRVVDGRRHRRSLVQPDGRLMRRDSKTTEEGVRGPEISDGADDLMAPLAELARERKKPADVPVAAAQLPRVENAAHRQGSRESVRDVAAPESRSPQRAAIRSICRS